MGITKAAIIGKGALGLLYGTLIAKNIGTNAVEYVMDDERFARHAADVITINGEPCGISTVPVREAQPVDLVILAVKATGLTKAIESMEHLVGPATRIVSLINGITSEERVAKRFGWQKTVLSVAQGMDAVFIGGALTFTHAGEIRFGAAPETDPSVVDDIADFYERAGIAHTVESDIRHRLWTKFMLNVGINQTCMAYEGTYGSASAPQSEQNRCFVAAMREALAVAQAEGVNVTEVDLAQMAALIATLDPEGIPSMAQDRINRKLTEVEEFSGTLIRLAERHGILVPQNRWLYNRIREIEEGF